MIVLAWNELCKSWKRILFTALQIAAILFLVIVMTTTVWERTAKYRPFWKYLDGEGAYGDLGAPYIALQLGTDGILQNMDKAESAVFVKTSQWYLPEDIMKSFSTIFYDDIVSGYRPELADGVWYTEAKGAGDVIEVVVTQNPYGIRVGDTIELCDAPWEEDPKTFRVHVCGMLAEGASYYTTRYYRDSGVEGFFETYSSREDSQYYMFASQSDVEKRGLLMLPGGQFLVRYSEPLTAEEKTWNEGYIGTALDGSLGNSFAEIREISAKQLLNQLMVILPVAAGAFLLVSLSVACSAAIGTMRSLKTYGVFYLCGMKWRGCVAISAIQAVFTGILSVLMVAFARSLMVRFGWGSAILFEVGPLQAAACALVLVYMVVLSCILPFGIMRRNSPIRVLRDTEL